MVMLQLLALSLCMDCGFTFHSPNNRFTTDAFAAFNRKVTRLSACTTGENGAPAGDHQPFVLNDWAVDTHGIHHNRNMTTFLTFINDQYNFFFTRQINGKMSVLRSCYCLVL